MRKLIPLTAAAALAALAGGPALGENAAAPAADTGVRLELSTPAGGANGELVRGGVPLPKDLGLTDTSRLGIWHHTGPDPDDGEWLPVQSEVTSRHGGLASDPTKAVRWALLQFPVTSAGTYWLHTDAPVATTGAPVAVDTAEKIEIDTGKLRFTVAKDRFSPLGGLRTVTRDRDGRELERMAVADGGLDVRMVLVERNEKGELVDREYLLSRTAVSDIAVEENGPLRAAVRIRGKFTDDKGQPLLYGYLGFTLRLWADRGSDQVRVFLTLENNGNYGPPSDPSRTTVKPMWVRVRDLELIVPTAMAAGKVRGSTSDGTWEIENFGSGTDFRLLQTHQVADRRNEAFNFRYDVTAGGKSVASGARSDGGLQVDDGTTSVAASVRHFWQSYPKAMSFDDGRLQVELFPKEPGQKWPADLPAQFGDAYEFEGGRHKTYEVMLAFAPTATNDAIAHRTRVFQDPPVFSLDPDWVKRSRAVGGAFATVGGAAPNLSLAEARAHFQRLQNAIVDVRWADAQGSDGEIPPASMREQRETRGHTLLEIAKYDLDLYGYMSFGDLPHDLGFASGHHDWVKGLFLNWLRHRKREYFDYGVEMLRHRYDIDQYHCNERADPNWKWYNGFQRFELGFHGARLDEFYPHGENTSVPQNTWLEGLLLAHALTGDPRALECARENADAFLNYFEVSGALDPTYFRGKLDYLGQLSAMSNGVQQLLAFYEYTGEQRYFDTAAKVFEYGLLRAEEYYGNKGFFDIKSNQLQVWPVVRLVHPLIEMHRHSGDPRALAMLIRLLNFFREAAYDGGKVDEDGRYMPLQLPYMWELEGSQLVARRWYIAYNFFTADGFAYAYAATKEPIFLDWARRVWRDGVIFLQAPMHQFVPPGFYSAASYSPRQYPNSETKVDVWVLGLSQYYLALEDALAARGAKTVEFPDDPYFAKRRATRKIAVETQPVGLGPSPHVPEATRPDLAPRPQDWLPPAPAASGATGTGGGAAQPAGTAPASGATPAVPAPAGPTPGVVTPAPSGATPGPISETAVGQAPNPNPTPKRDEVAALAKPIEMDDRDAVFSPDWTIQQSDQAYARSMRVAGGDRPGATATFTIPVTRAGTYRLYLWWPEVAGAARDTPVEVRQSGAWDRFHVDQTRESNRWRLICNVSGSPTEPVVVKFGGIRCSGLMVADGIRLLPLGAPNADR